ncbi:MAG: serine hydrolase [Bacteroidota bacterium]
MRKLLLLGLLSLLLLPVSLSQQVDLKALDAYFTQVQQDWEIPGMSIAIVKDGKQVFSKGYGVAELGKNTPVDGNTLYAIASNSKAFTSATMATLVQEGTLSWDDKVKSYLPYFEVYDPWVSQQVSVRDLLSHRVGLGTFSGDIMWYNVELSSEEIIKRIKYVPQAFEFRAGYGYSNLMFITAGELIRVVTGKTFGENVQERFLDPLGMDRTIYLLSELETKGNYATPHAFFDGEHYPIQWTSWEEIAATGGMISSVNDLSKWMIFNMDHGIHEGDTLLTADSRNMVWTPHNTRIVDHTTPNDFKRNFSGYGLGWGLSDYHGQFRVAHTGGYDGMITSVDMLPDVKLGVVVLTNGMKSPIRAVSQYVMDAYLGVEPKDWSKILLDRRNEGLANDTRIQSRKDSRVPNTTPSLPLSAFVGTYHADLYGHMYVKEEDRKLTISFEHTPVLAANLEHWHYDTFKLDWSSDYEHAWFSFGTVQFLIDHNRRVSGIAFDVPNDDFFFEEINARKVEEK